VQGVTARVSSPSCLVSSQRPLKRPRCLFFPLNSGSPSCKVVCPPRNAYPSEHVSPLGFPIRRMSPAKLPLLRADLTSTYSQGDILGDGDPLLFPSLVPPTSYRFLGGTLFPL